MDLENHHKALKLAETGNYQQAMEGIDKHLQTSPDDAEALNDAGAILHCLGRCDEAIEHLVRAKTLRPDSAEIIWNLAEAYLAAGRADEAPLGNDDKSIDTVELYVYTADAVRIAARKSFGLEQKPVLSKIDNLVVGKLSSN